MENSIFTAEELAQWKTLKYACINDPATFNILLSSISSNVLNGVFDKSNLLFYASKHNSTSVKYLLNCEKFTNESINAVNNLNQTAVHIACSYQPEAVKYLLNCERITVQTINTKSVNGYTALHCACVNHNDSIEYLLNCDKFTYASINAVTNKGNTAFHFVCEKKNSKYIDMFISSDKLTAQTVKAKNSEEYTALDLVNKYNENTEIVQRLTNYIRSLENSCSTQNHDPNHKLTIIQLQIENTELKLINAQLELKILELSS